MLLRELFETVRDKVTKKTSLDIDDLDFMMDHAEPTGQKIRGLEVWEGDPSEIQEDGEFMLLIKDPRRDGFVAGLEINRAPEGYHFTQVFMVPELQGKNIAIEMYKMAIKDFGFIIATDETQTKGAESIWQKLAKTPGIDVYAWNTAKDSFHHWDPDEDDTTNVYYDQDEIDELNKEKKEFRGELMKQLMNGEISKDDFKDHLQKKFHQIDSYIKSLTDVKTDKVLLVAKETDGNDLSERKVEYITKEEMRHHIDDLLQYNNTVFESSNDEYGVKNFLDFIDTHTQDPKVGSECLVVFITATPKLRDITMEIHQKPMKLVRREGREYIFENGVILTELVDGLIHIRKPVCFESINDIEKFSFLVDITYGWNRKVTKVQ